jgi:hypothetical protein
MAPDGLQGIRHVGLQDRVPSLGLEAHRAVLTHGELGALTEGLSATTFYPGGWYYPQDRLQDLALVCRNCHAAIHANGRTSSLDDVRRKVTGKA